MSLRTAALLSSVLLVACDPPRDQHWEIWAIQDACGIDLYPELEEAILDAPLVVRGATEAEFQVFFGNVEGDCTEPQDDLRTCVFDLPSATNGVPSTCPLVLVIDRDWIGIEDPGWFDDVELFEDVQLFPGGLAPY